MNDIELIKPCKAESAGGEADLRAGSKDWWLDGSDEGYGYRGATGIIILRAMGRTD